MAARRSFQGEGDQTAIPPGAFWQTPQGQRELKTFWLYMTLEVIVVIITLPFWWGRTWK